MIPSLQLATGTRNPSDTGQETGEQDSNFDKKILRQPRIELGAQRWQRWILPLNHWRF